VIDNFFSNAFKIVFGFTYNFLCLIAKWIGGATTAILSLLVFFAGFITLACFQDHDVVALQSALGCSTGVGELLMGAAMMLWITFWVGNMTMFMEYGSDGCH
jgi:hypothetical protein